jgi:hypothetical protein
VSVNDLVAVGNVVNGVARYTDGSTGTYPTTATTQAADAATLEAEKAYLLATKTITFGASSVVGTLVKVWFMGAIFVVMSAKNLNSFAGSETYWEPSAQFVVSVQLRAPVVVDVHV